MAEIVLDVCTPEGKTWLARVVGKGGKFGIEREFINATESNLSKSGMTGSKTYVVTDGVYESNEGRKRYGRTYYIVKGDEVTTVDRDTALKELEGG